MTLTFFRPIQVEANTCGPPKRLSVPRACGLVLNHDGRPIPDLEIGLASASGEVIDATTTDASGGFHFSSAKPGAYVLYSKSETWDIVRWPIKFSKAKQERCDRPLYLVLARKTGWGCGSWITKKKPELT